MELLPIIIGVQELLLAALILYSIPVPETSEWLTNECQQREALAPSHTSFSPPASTGAWSVPSGFICFGAVSCLIGYVLGLYISNWDLRPVLRPEYSSGNDVKTYHSRLKCEQYYQQCIQLGCGAVASAANASAVRLSLLAGQAAEAAAAAGEAAAAAAAAAAATASKQLPARLDMDMEVLRYCSADWVAIGASPSNTSEAVLLSGSITSGTELAVTSTENVQTVHSRRSSNGGDISTDEHAMTDASAVSDGGAATGRSSCGIEVSVCKGNAAATYTNASQDAAVTATAPALLQQLVSAACGMRTCLAVQPLQQQHLFQLQQQQQHQEAPPPPQQKQQQQQWLPVCSLGLPLQQQQQQQQQQELLPVRSPAPKPPMSSGSTSTAALQKQSRANTAITPLGCGWICVLSCSTPDEEHLLQLQDPLMWRQGVACNSVQQQGVPGEDISLSVVLGAGAYGKVYKGQWRGQPVAVKILYHTGSLAAAKVAEEAAIMLQAQHENVIRSHHVLMWQRPKTNSSSSSGNMHANTNGMSSMFSHNFNEPAQPSSGAAADGVLQDSSIQNNGSSAPLCSVIQETQECEPGGWLQNGHDGIDDDDVEAQTWIVQELCDGGPLDAAIRDGRIAGMEQVLSCLVEIARGLEYLHSKGLVHGDLKAANVCLVNVPPEGSQAVAAAGAAAKAAGTCQPGYTGPSPSSSRRGSGTSAAGKDFVCKVMDFSLTKTLDPGKTHCSTHSLGTVTHVAPELLVSGKQSRAADVYSYGMIVWEVLNKGKLPYHGLHSVEIVQRIVHQQQRPDWQADADPQLVALAEQCWAADPVQRPSISNVCARLLQLQQAVQHLKESSLLSSTYSSTAEGSAVSIMRARQQQQLGSSLSAPLPDMLPAAPAIHGSRSYPVLAVDNSCGSTSSNSSSHSGRGSLAPAACYSRQGGVPAQNTSGGSSPYRVSPLVMPCAVWASTCPGEVAGKPNSAAAVAAAGMLTPSPTAAAADDGAHQEGAVNNADGGSVNSNSSKGDLDMPEFRQPPKRSFSFSHVLSQPAALLAIPEQRGAKQDPLNLTLKVMPGQQGCQAPRPDDQASLEVARTRVRVMISPDSPESPDSQAGGVDQAGIVDQVVVTTGDQAVKDSIRTADQAALESVTGTWKMRRHSHGSVGRALRAAASISSAVAMADHNGDFSSGAAIAVAAAAAPSGGGSPATTVDSSALEPWEGLLVTGRKGMIRGIDCSALDDEDLSSTWQQRQQKQEQQRRTGTEAAVISQNAAMASAASAGDAFGPMVGYWD